jgi:hypothetical protein
MQTYHWTRKLLGRSVTYRIEAEENKADGLIRIRVCCLEPKVLFDMLSRTPQLIGKQLLNLAMDGAQQILKYYKLKELTTFFYSENQILMHASFSI